MANITDMSPSEFLCLSETEIETEIEDTSLRR